MSERKLPPVGKWVPHDGGPCPVPEESKVVVMWSAGEKGDWRAKYFCDHWSKVVAFCVTEYPDEEETRTGTFKVGVYRNGKPAFFDADYADPDFPTGACTTTTVNGKLRRIVWEADE
jgi:hypothetical protein